jgi:hypothetical protein
VCVVLYLRVFAVAMRVLAAAILEKVAERAPKVVLRRGNSESWCVEYGVWRMVYGVSCVVYGVW